MYFRCISMNQVKIHSNIEQINWISLKYKNYSILFTSRTDIQMADLTYRIMRVRNRKGLLFKVVVREGTFTLITPFTPNCRARLLRSLTTITTTTSILVEKTYDQDIAEFLNRSVSMIFFLSSKQSLESGLYIGLLTCLLFD